MLSTKYLYEISDINKSRLGVAGRAALVGGAGFAAYHAIKGDGVEKPESDDPSTTSKVVDGVKKSVKGFVKNVKDGLHLQTFGKNDAVNPKVLPKDSTSINTGGQMTRDDVIKQQAAKKALFAPSNRTISNKDPGSRTSSKPSLSNSRIKRVSQDINKTKIINSADNGPGSRTSKLGLNVNSADNGPGSRTSKLGLNTDSDRKRMNDNGLRNKRTSPGQYQSAKTPDINTGGQMSVTDSQKSIAARKPMKQGIKNFFTKHYSGDSTYDKKQYIGE